MVCLKFICYCRFVSIRVIRRIERLQGESNGKTMDSGFFKFEVEVFSEVRPWSNKEK